MTKNYNKMATYAFTSACRNSVTSNWSVSKIELENMFNVKLNAQDFIEIIGSMVNNFGNAILDISLTKKKIDCYEPPREEYAIDFILGTDYCLNVEEENDKY